MNRYERRVQFEQLCSMRDAYRAARAEHVGVMSVPEAIAYGEALAADREALASVIGVTEEAPDHAEATGE